jgi:integrase/recombinase XerD
MRAAKLRYPDGRVSWSMLDDLGETVGTVRAWVVHLEQTRMSPNTIERFVKHVADLGSFLHARGKGFDHIGVPDYDAFLAARERYGRELPSSKLVAIRPLPHLGAGRMSPSLRNQIHLAVKSFYRHLVNNDHFEIEVRDRRREHASSHSYRPFLEHIQSRRRTRRRDAYNRGDFGHAQRRVAAKRLTPEQVLALVQSCHLLRDAFLVVLLYNTGLRIGEALGLRHVDVDVTERVVWVVPRDDNENGARAKAGRTRAVPVHEYVIRMYEDLVTSGEYAAAFECGSEYVFCNVVRGRVGRAMTSGRAKKLYLQLATRSGVRFHWHMLRHSHASEAIAAGYSLLEVADRLGHASPQTTVEFYRHLFSAEVRKLYLTGPERVEVRLAELREAYLLKKDVRWL